MPSLDGTTDNLIRIEQASGLPAILAALRDLDQTHLASDAFPFSGPGYLAALFEAYHEYDDPHLLTAFSADQFVGILPLIARPLTRLGLRVQEYGFPFNPNTIINDCLLSGKDPMAVGSALLQRAYAIGAQSLILDHLPDSASNCTADCLVLANQNLSGPSDPPTAARALFHTQIEGDYDRFMATRSRNHRWQIKKTWRKAHEAGDLRVVAHAGADAIRTHLNDWFAVEERSWQGQDPASAMTAADRRFHTTLLNTLPANEVGRLWMAYLDGAPIAALRMIDGIGTLGPKTCVHTMHFDATHRKLGPGLVTFDAMVQDACARGLSEIDMHGTTDFFARWSTGTRPHSTVRLYRPGLRGMALQRARRINRQIEARALTRG